MSGLVVRPGDTLFLRVMGAWPVEAGKIEADFETAMPGVKVRLTGHEGPPFVYRPRSLVADDELPDEAAKLTEAALTRVREAQARVEREVPDGMSTVDNPVTGRPLGYIRVDDGDDAP